MTAPAAARIVHVGDRSVPLPPVLHDLFGALLSGDGEPLSCDELRRMVGIERGHVCGHVATLRELLPELTFHTHPAYGYSLARVGVLG